MDNITKEIIIHAFDYAYVLETLVNLGYRVFMGTFDSGEFIFSQVVHVLLPMIVVKGVLL